MFRGGSTIVIAPSRARRIMLASHATDVKAGTTECTVCELVTASMRSRWRMIIPRTLSNVSDYSETSGESVTYCMVAHFGLFVAILCCVEIAAGEAGGNDVGSVKQRDRSRGFCARTVTQHLPSQRRNQRHLTRTRRFTDTYISGDAGQANATTCFGPIPSCAADRLGAPCNFAISAGIKTLCGIAGNILDAVSRSDR